MLRLGRMLSDVGREIHAPRDLESIEPWRTGTKTLAVALTSTSTHRFDPVVPEFETAGAHTAPISQVLQRHPGAVVYQSDDSRSLRVRLPHADLPLIENIEGARVRTGSESALVRTGAEGARLWVLLERDDVCDIQVLQSAVVPASEVVR